MTFQWHFFTGDEEVVPETLRQCHRGPMIDVEIVMSKPFTYVPQINTLRQLLLDAVVDTTLVEVRTREVVLRTLNTLLGPIFVRLSSQKPALQVRICEKRNSLDIEADLEVAVNFYLAATRDLPRYKVPSQHVELLIAALQSNSPVMRVAGKCALILLYAFIETDYVARSLPS